jgi:hypothetical protein
MILPTHQTALIETPLQDSRFRIHAADFES